MSFFFFLSMSRSIAAVNSGECCITTPVQTNLKVFPLDKGGDIMNVSWNITAVEILLCSFETFFFIIYLFYTS